MVYGVAQSRSPVATTASTARPRREASESRLMNRCQRPLSPPFPDLFTQCLSTPSSPRYFLMGTNRSMGSTVRCTAPLIFFRHCTMPIPFSMSDRATSGAFFFDFHTANYQFDYTKVVPLYTSFNFVIRILISYSLDQA
jgi:hypothetical protein